MKLLVISVPLHGGCPLDVAVEAALATIQYRCSELRYDLPTVTKSLIDMPDDTRKYRIEVKTE